MTPSIPKVELRDKKGNGVGSDVFVHLVETGELIGRLTYNDHNNWHVTGFRGSGMMLDFDECFAPACSLAQEKYPQG